MLDYIQIFGIYIQIFDIMIGLLLMCVFGYTWSSDILHRAISKNTTRKRSILYINLIGFLLGLSLCIVSNLWTNSDHKKESVKKQPVYILFLDSSIIKDTHSRINNEALKILNNFLEKTNTKLIITSDDRINHTTQTNWPINVLRSLYKTQGVKGTIIGSIPYTKYVFTRDQEINLWYNITRIEHDGCVILDKTNNSINKMSCTVKVKGLLNNRHIIAILDKLKIVPDPDIFKERLQTYDESVRTKFG